MAGAFAPALAWGHVRLLEPAPRSPRDDLKTGPCGGFPPGRGERTTLEAGAPFTVSFRETVDHPGWFRIAFSPEGDGGYDANVLADDIPPLRGDVERLYVFTLLAPDEPCERCSLQVVQAMTENPQNPRYYYSCADIRIVRGAPPDAAPPPDAGTATDAAPRHDTGFDFPDGGVALPDGGVAGPDGGAARPDGRPVRPADAALAADAGAVDDGDAGGGCAATPVGGHAALLLVLAGLLRRRRV